MITNSPIDLSKPSHSRNLNNLTHLVDTNAYTKTPFGYATSNARVYDSMRSQMLFLDRPHITGEVPFKDMYSSKLNKYKVGPYKDYSDISGGSIQYYVTNESINPYHKPLFASPSTVHLIKPVDPNGIVRPQFQRIPKHPYHWNSCMPTNCNSSTHDALQFREDIISRQMQKRNESDFVQKMK